MKTKHVPAKTTLFLLIFLSFFTWLQAKNYQFKLGVVTSKDHPHSISAREFADRIKKHSKEQITISVFDSGSLGSNPELLDGVKTGAIDFTINTPGIMAEYEPTIGLLELNYIFESIDHMKRVTQGKVGRKIALDYEKKSGMKILGYLGGAQRNMITRSTEIRSIADLSGLKMRTWEWKVMLDWWKELGAMGSVVSFPEVYTALQTGVVDGAENEFSTFTTARWAEVAKKIALTRHSITVRPLVMNQTSFKKLPRKLQKLVVKIGKEIAAFDLALENQKDQENLALLKSKYGVVITEPDRTPFMEKSKKIIDQFASERNLEKIVKMIRRAN